MENYFINKNQSFKESLLRLDKNTEKCLIVVDKKKKIFGTLTDGDVRRALLQKATLNSKIFSFVKKKPIVLKVKQLKNLDNELKNKVKILLTKIKDDHIDIIPVIDKTKKVIKILFTKNFKDYFSYNNDLSETSVLIMAGGKGTRMKPFSNYFPKPLFPVEDKTAAEYIIKKFEDYGVKKFFMSVFYKKNLIKSYFKENNKKNLKFIEEKNPMGTAGSISLLKNKVKKDFFIINCDTLLTINFLKLYEFHRSNNFTITVVAASKNIKIPYGTCDTNKHGILKKIIEKPTFSYLVNVGLYLLKPEVIKKVPQNRPVDMNELLQRVKKQKMKIGVYPVDENSWVDLGSTQN